MLLGAEGMSLDGFSALVGFDQSTVDIEDYLEEEEEDMDREDRDESGDASTLVEDILGFFGADQA